MDDVDQDETSASGRAVTPVDEGEPRAKRGLARKLRLLGVGMGLLVLMSAWVAFLGWALFQLRHLV